MAQLVKNPPAVWETWAQSLGREDPPEKGRLPTPVFLGFPCGSVGKESTCYAGDLGSIPGLGRSPGKGNGNPPQYSGLENSMDCIVHEVTNSQTQLSDFHYHYTTCLQKIKMCVFTSAFHGGWPHSYLVKTREGRTLVNRGRGQGHPSHGLHVLDSGIIPLNPNSKF